MAKYDRFWIGPLQSGLERNLEPFLISDDAFFRLQNAYNYRGRIRKRFGAELLQDTSSPPIAGFPQFNSRLRIQVDTITGGNAAGTVPGIIFKKGQAFSVDNIMFTVFNDTAGPQQMYRTDGLPDVATYDVGTGAYDIQNTGKPNGTAVFWYPAESVMGFTVYEQGNINQDPTYAFDTQFAYQYIGGGWNRLSAVPATDPADWTGTNSDFFWSRTWRGDTNSGSILYVSNFNFGVSTADSDRIKYWDGAAWTDLVPQFSATATDTIMTARCIIEWKDRLWLFNVVENTGGAPGTNIQLQNVVAYSQNGSPLAADAWRRDIPGKGSFLVCPTKEAIVSVSLLKDRCLVYFEKSTWELVYTGNQIVPAVWQKLNSELGAESTFSIVNFDRVVLGIGQVGIHASSGASVERVDHKIPDEVFKIHNANDGPLRVHGVRDFEAEQVYWSFPASEGSPTFPTRVLVYNYTNGTWAFNDDSITAWGYFNNPSQLTWATWNFTWASSNFPWNSGSNQSQFRNVIAGNQEGYTFNIKPLSNPSNSPSLQITDINVGNNQITIIDHNLSSQDFILIENVQGTTGINDVIYRVTFVDADTISIIGTFTGVYTGGGTVKRVSRIDILTKQYNMYNKQGMNVYIPRVEFYVNNTNNGQLLVDFWVSDSSLSLVDEGTNSGTLLGTSVLETFPDPNITLETEQGRFWRSVYSQAEGETVQLRIYYTDEQMVALPEAGKIAIPLNDFVLNSFILYGMPTADR